MTRRVAFSIAAAALLAAGGSLAIAQYALDGGLSARTGRVNPGRAKTAMSKPVYTVNQRTGTYTYNRANAFNDTSYSVYQRYTGNRTENFTPAGVSTAGRVRTTPPRSASTYRSASATRTTRPPRPTNHAVRAPTYRPAARATTARPASPISSPRYSVSRNRTR